VQQTFLVDSNNNNNNQQQQQQKKKSEPVFKCVALVYKYQNSMPTALGKKGVAIIPHKNTYCLICYEKDGYLFPPIFINAKFAVTIQADAFVSFYDSNSNYFSLRLPSMTKQEEFAVAIAMVKASTPATLNANKGIVVQDLNYVAAVSSPSPSSSSSDVRYHMRLTMNLVNDDAHPYAMGRCVLDNSEQVVELQSEQVLPAIRHCIHHHALKRDAKKLVIASSSFCFGHKGHAVLGVPPDAVLIITMCVDSVEHKHQAPPQPQPQLPHKPQQPQQQQPSRNGNHKHTDNDSHAEVESAAATQHEGDVAFVGTHHHGQHQHATPQTSSMTTTRQRMARIAGATGKQSLLASLLHHQHEPEHQPQSEPDHQPEHQPEHVQVIDDRIPRNYHVGSGDSEPPTLTHEPSVPTHATHATHVTHTAYSPPSASEQQAPATSTLSLSAVHNKLDAISLQIGALCKRSSESVPSASDLISCLSEMNVTLEENRTELESLRAANDVLKQKNHALLEKNNALMEMQYKSLSTTHDETIELRAQLKALASEKEGVEKKLSDALTQLSEQQTNIALAEQRASAKCKEIEGLQVEVTRLTQSEEDNAHALSEKSQDMERLQTEIESLRQHATAIENTHTDNIKRQCKQKMDEMKQQFRQRIAQYTDDLAKRILNFVYSKYNEEDENLNKVLYRRITKKIVQNPQTFDDSDDDDETNAEE